MMALAGVLSCEQATALTNPAIPRARAKNRFLILSPFLKRETRVHGCRETHDAYQRGLREKSRFSTWKFDGRHS